MTCRDELKRRLRASFPELEKLELMDKMIDAIIEARFRARILGKGEQSTSLDTVIESWESDYVRPDLLPFEPTEEEMLAYTE